MNILQKKQKNINKIMFLNKLKKSLLKTRQNLNFDLFNSFFKKKIDDSLFDKLEEHLLIADVGIKTTHKIINNLILQINKEELKDIVMLYDKLRDELLKILNVSYNQFILECKKPYIILVIGVNGAGKTTTVCKLANQYCLAKKTVIIAAGDTFRPAAVDQLQVYANVNKIPIVSKHIGADSASVIFDAIELAKLKNIDVVIVDTAGRLQNKIHLIEELKKIVYVIKKYDKKAPNEILLTLDANIGQNAINQVKIFNAVVKLTGIVLTKLDGTAKGGIIFQIVEQFCIPVRYIGLGEHIDDLYPFNASEFVNALF